MESKEIAGVVVGVLILSFLVVATFCTLFSIKNQRRKKKLIKITSQVRIYIYSTIRHD